MACYRLLSHTVSAQNLSVKDSIEAKQYRRLRWKHQPRRPGFSTAERDYRHPGLHSIILMYGRGYGMMVRPSGVGSVNRGRGVRSLNMDDAQLIERCIELAGISAQKGNHPFGALIVHEGQIIAEGENRVFTEMDPSAHAEVVAVRGACRSLGRQTLAGCTLYTSAEPCLICSTVVRLTGISRVVFAAPASGAYGGYSSIYPILRDTTIARFGLVPEVVPELLADRSIALWHELGWPPPAR